MKKTREEIKARNEEIRQENRLKMKANETRWRGNGGFTLMQPIISHKKTNEKNTRRN